MPSKQVLTFYVLGLVPTVVGAAAVNVTESLIPLAMGASLSVRATAAVVRKLLARERPS